jgi:hypothetical protein
VTGFLVSAATGLGNAIYIYHIKSTLSGSDTEVAYLLAVAFGAGFISSAFASRLKTPILTSIILSVSFLSLSYFGLSVLRNIWPFILCYALGDFVNSIYIIHTDSFIQANVDSEKIGIIKGFMTGVGSIGTLVAMLAASFLIEKMTTSKLYFVGSLLYVSAVAFCIIANIRGQCTIFFKTKKMKNQFNNI